MWFKQFFYIIYETSSTCLDFPFLACFPSAIGDFGNPNKMLHLKFEILLYTGQINNCECWLGVF